ncbi:serine/threonine-protein kinase [Mangrovihabitans endophyticus]|uniref:Protein kinase domain-containing protein n=1 Tax=Mangrovihabitans endophyticus TaxID=1751298 RepID=A0A8J3C079_9ACTN|nr:serine/threonine-protein kinase [Mangrovihabitans endophyticus]GGL00174.1 hypothetical protein GCM10012284_38240 [Mangrovihabitans endophyticus]
MTMPLRPGEPTRLGRYDLTGRLGQGGMGTVYLGRDPDGRPVAIKVVRPEFAGDAEFRGRFRSEVHRAQQVPPFSTAEVLDADPDHEPPYLVVEYVDGPSLATVIRDRGPLSGAALDGLAVGIATALGAIHGAGVIHRDLKPGNVLVAPGGIKVIDFGIARAFEATSQHTRTDQMVGTVAYMAPERFDPAHGRQVTAAADVFAWGAVVAYAATGRTPFESGTAPATAMRILTQPPDLDGVPESLRDPLEWALAKEPADRPTARKLLDMLLAGDTPRPPHEAAAVTAVGAPPTSGTARRATVRRVALAVVAAAVLVGGGWFGIGALRGRADPATGAGAAPGASSPAPATASPTAVDLPGAILRGERQTLIHVVEIDRDLALDLHAAQVQALDGTGPKSLFALVPYGVDYLIRTLREGTGEPQTCLGVKIVPDRSASLVPVSCTPTRATIFSLSPTEGRDDHDRPAFLLSNEAYGVVQWSPSRRQVIVEELGDAPALSSFSFVDRGDL